MSLTSLLSSQFDALFSSSLHGIRSRAQRRSGEGTSSTSVVDVRMECEPKQSPCPNPDTTKALSSDRFLDEEALTFSGAKLGFGAELQAVASLMGGLPPPKVVTYDSLDPSMQLLGHGEFASVWRTGLGGRQVALKTLKKSGEDAVRGLTREIMLMTLMDHPNVLPGLALGQKEGQPFMVLTLLSTVLRRELPRPVETVPFWVAWREARRWPMSRAMRCASEIGSALRYCHHDAFFPHFRVIHRDIKPENVGFLADGRAVLFDFGLAALWQLTKPDGNGGCDAPTDTHIDAPRQLSGETGSLRYMAPEVAHSRPYNHKADVFSFATLFWEMLSKQKPSPATQSIDSTWPLTWASDPSSRRAGPRR
jgi:serine/threonine protein kinase